MSEWKPIETAPIQEWVMVYDPSTKPPYPKQITLMRDEEGIWYDSLNGDALLNMKYQSVVHPTHWMPLSKPPEKSW